MKRNIICKGWTSKNQTVCKRHNLFVLKGIMYIIIITRFIRNLSFFQIYVLQSEYDKNNAEKHVILCIDNMFICFVFIGTPVLFSIYNLWIGIHFFKLSAFFRTWAFSDLWMTVICRLTSDVFHSRPYFMFDIVTIVCILSWNVFFIHVF